MNTVRAKFVVASVVAGAISDGIGKTVTLTPVTTGSAENEQFYRMTPGGQLTLSTINEAAAAQFEPGAEFYLDLTRAEAPAVAEAPAEAETAQAE